MWDKEVLPCCGEESNKMETLSPPHDTKEGVSPAGDGQLNSVITESMLETEKDMEKVTMEKEAEMKRQAQKVS